MTATKTSNVRIGDLDIFFHEIGAGDPLRIAWEHRFGRFGELLSKPGEQVYRK